MKEAFKRICGAFGWWPYARWPYLRRAYAWRRPSGPKRVLSKAAFAPVQLSCAPASPHETDAWRAWTDLPGGIKMVNYFGVYQRVVDRFADRPVRMLEIGVLNGASMKMWRRLLHPESVIVAIDINPDCARFDAPDEGLHVRIGDQSDKTFLSRVADEFGPFDIVIDDGSHVVSHMIASFDALFLDHVAPGGVWISEDTHTNYLRYFRDRRYSFVDLARDLADLMHMHYSRANIGDFYAGTARLSLPRIATVIEEIAFVDSTVVITKKKSPALPVGVSREIRR